MNNEEKYLCNQKDYDSLNLKVNALRSYGKKANDELEFLKKRINQLDVEKKELWNEVENELKKLGYIDEINKYSIRFNDEGQFFCSEPNENPIASILENILRR